MKDFVIGIRESGLSLGACNVYVRSIDSFLTWLQENGYVTEPLRLRQLPQPKKVIPIFSDAHVQALLKFKPMAGLNLSAATHFSKMEPGRNGLSQEVNKRFDIGLTWV